MKILLFFLTIQCAALGFGQNDSINKKEIKMKTFDETYYKKLKVNKDYTSSSIDQFYTDGTDCIRVTVYKGQNIRSVEKTINNTPFTEIEYYDLGTNTLIEKGQRFSEVPYGTWLHYDSDGKVINETDFETNFSFGIHDLISKMKEDYQIYLLNKFLINVNRSYRENYDLSFYDITVRSLNDSEHGKKYIIDGGNGATITIIYWTEGDNTDIQIEQALEQYKRK